VGLASVTLARLRAAQGDAAGARAVIAELMRRDPSDARARALLDALATVLESEHAEPDDEAPQPPRAADAASLRGAFRTALAGGRAARLRRWLEAIGRNRGERRDVR
jgi:thioredoxin-like negative regulator of GroEL